jgi:hypothetical protein
MASPAAHACDEHVLRGQPETAWAPPPGVRASSHGCVRVRNGRRPVAARTSLAGPGTSPLRVPHQHGCRSRDSCGAPRPPSARPMPLPVPRRRQRSLPARPANPAGVRPPGPSGVGLGRVGPSLHAPRGPGEGPAAVQHDPRRRRTRSRQATTSRQHSCGSPVFEDCCTRRRRAPAVRPRWGSAGVVVSDPKNCGWALVRVQSRECGDGCAGGRRSEVPEGRGHGWHRGRGLAADDARRAGADLGVAARRPSPTQTVGAAGVALGVGSVGRTHGAGRRPQGRGRDGQQDHRGQRSPAQFPHSSHRITPAPPCQTPFRALRPGPPAAAAHSRSRTPS